MIQRMCLNAAERVATRKIIREKTGYLIMSKNILNQVFRRSSVAAETGQNSNEIFEFIGDEVLSFYVTKIVSERCGAFSSMTGTGDYAFRIRENQFTRIKQSLVSNETLARIIDEWDVFKYLFCSKSDIKNEVIKETKVKADLLEAIIGAIAIESNWDPQILETAVSKALRVNEIIDDIIESEAMVIGFDINNAVTKLKELAERGQCTMPEYSFSDSNSVGYDSDGNPIWICSCSIFNEQQIWLMRQVEANSKKDAKKAAAYLILCELFGAQNQYHPNDGYPFWAYKEGKLFPNRPQKQED